MSDYLLWIGVYNLLAPLIFVPMIFSFRFADLVLRRGTEIIAEPYSAGRFDGLWLLWLSTTNAALGIIMVLARGWSAHAQREVTMVVLAVYVAMWLAMLIRARGPKWGRGIYVTHGLWVAQIAWGAWALRASG